MDRFNMEVTSAAVVWFCGTTPLSASRALSYKIEGKIECDGGGAYYLGNSIDHGRINWHIVEKENLGIDNFMQIESRSILCAGCLTILLVFTISSCTISVHILSSIT